MRVSPSGRMMRSVLSHERWRPREGRVVGEPEIGFDEVVLLRNDRPPFGLQFFDRVDLEITDVVQRLQRVTFEDALRQDHAAEERVQRAIV